MDDIAAAVKGARAYLADNPADARYTDSRATAAVEDGLRIRVAGPGGEEVWTDMPAGVGGTSSAPSPGWLLRAATAACVTSLIVMRAAEFGVDVDGLTVSVDSESDDRGILGMEESVPAGPLSGRVVVELPGRAAPDGFTELCRWALEHCPVSDAVRRAVPLELVIHPGG